MSMPAAVVRIRRQICSRAGCAHVHDYEESCAQCPGGFWGKWDAQECGAAEPSAPPIAAPMQAEGPTLWQELHARPAKYDPATELDWLQTTFAGKLPCGLCRAHWLELIACDEPRIDTAENYEQWTIDAHNHVNKRLGKPVWQKNLTI